MKYIDSEHNKIIRLVKSLDAKKHREANSLFVAEGKRFVLDAVKDNIAAEFVIISNEELLDTALKLTDTVYKVSEQLYHKLSDTKAPQGILGVFQQNIAKIETLDTKKSYLLLNHIQDPGNLGTIIRSCDAFGFGGVILDDECCDIYNPKVLRATMGSIFRTKVYQVPNLKTVIELLKEQNVYAACIDKTAKMIYETDFSKEFSVILGNEGNGIEKTLIELADGKVVIPMVGKTESLNVSICGSMIMYESLRQKSLKNL